MKQTQLKRVERLLKVRWLTNWQLSQLFPSALRRVRELREKGFNVQKRREVKNGKVTNTWSYKIV